MSEFGEKGIDFGPLADTEEELSFFIGDIECLTDLRDQADFLTEQVTPEGPAASVKIKCLWKDRFNLIAALMGKNYVKDGNQITRDLPFEYPSLNGIFCTSIPAITGEKPYRDDTGNWSGMPGWMAFRYAVLTAIFSKPPYQIALDDSPEDNDLSNIPFCTTTLKVSAQTIQPPAGTYYLNGGSQSGSPIQNTTIALPFTRFEITMRRWFMPVVPIWDIVAQAGCTNNSPFQLTVASFSEGTVLFTGVELEQVADPSTGIVLWNIDYKFLANADTTWNMALDKDGLWQPISTVAAGGGQVPFPQSDLEKLLADEFATEPYSDVPEPPA